MKFYSKIIIAVFTLILLAGALPSDNDIYFKMTKSIDLFGRIYKEITLNYVDEVEPEKFMMEGINGMLSSLDPYTVFIDESHKEDIDLITTGKYGGIGATVGVRNEKVTIVDLIEGFSAQRQGMRIGDVIKYVDSVNVTSQNYNKLGLYMKGKPGTEVRIVVEREGEDQDVVFNLIREEIIVKNVSFYGFVPENSNNAYLKLSSFSRSAGEEIKDAIIDLQKEKPVKSIVLDLRGNPGGLLDAAIDVSDKFLKSKQLIVSVIGRDTDSKKEYFAKEEPVAGNIELAVLTNGGSASASEIVAGAIQDHDRGIVVGEKSFGKGLVQTVIPLSYKSSLKITTAKYYTPSGRCIQKINYSENNEVFQKQDELNSQNYKTDNSRIVVSSDGIMPDSIVSYNSDSKQIKNLLAGGMFFKFATKYYNQNSEADFLKITDDEFFNSFMDFLKNEKYSYISESEKLVEDLSKSIQNEGYNNSVIENISKLKTEIENAKLFELNKYKESVVSEIRKEMAARTDGNLGRIKQSLLNDKQFEAAYNILCNQNLYASILNQNNQH